MSGNRQWVAKPPPCEEIFVFTYMENFKNKTSHSELIVLFLLSFPGLFLSITAITSFIPLFEYLGEVLLGLMFWSFIGGSLLGVIHFLLLFPAWSILKKYENTGIYKLIRYYYVVISLISIYMTYIGYKLFTTFLKG